MPQATYQFNTTLLADIRKCAADMISFVDNVQASGYGFVRWEVDGRRMSAGTIQFTTNAPIPDYVLYGLDVSRVSGAPVPTYQLTTGLLADFRKSTNDMMAFFENLSGAGIVIQSIIIDGRTLANGQVAVTLNDVASVTAIFGLDVTRVA